MKGKKILLTISIVAILVVICLLVVMTIQKPKELNSYIQTKNISNVSVSTCVPEDFDKPFDFNLTTDEIANLSKLIDFAKVERKFGYNDYDTVGLGIKFEYTDGTSIEVHYRHYVMLDDNWYILDGYVFEYIYETDSFKTAIANARNS